MPKLNFAILIASVIAAATITVWLLSLAGAGVLAAALPAVMIAALAIRFLGR